MESILETITHVLSFVLSCFTTVFGFITSNPIIAISVYIPLAIFLITLAFSLISRIFSKKDTD